MRRRSASLGELSELVASVVTRGGHLEIVAVGRSMTPGITPGDVLLLGPLRAGEPRLGQVLVWERQGRLVVHRLVEVRGDVLVTRGDASGADDLPIARGQVLALVRGVRRTLARRLARALWTTAWAAARPDRR